MNTYLSRQFLFVLLLSGSAILTGACTWVEPTANAENVVVVEARHVTQCERLGVTSASVRDRVGFIDRSESRVAEELATLAKNSAVTMGGDTLVANSGIVDGSQEFIVYRCN
jgi:hypothetical protein